MTKLRVGVGGLLVVLGGGLAAAQTRPAVELKVNTAALIRDNAPVDLAPAADRFGPGLDSVDLGGAPVHKQQLRWTCRELPEGEYYLGLLVLTPEYFRMGDYGHSQLHLYLNDTRVAWTSYTAPCRPENAAEKSGYQVELRVDAPVRVRPGEVLRVVYVPEGAAVTVGPLRLYRTPPEGGIIKLPAPDWGKPNNLWLTATWGEPQREGEVIRQPVELLNPGVLTRKLRLEARAKDYLLNPLLATTEELTLEPGRKVARTFEFRPGDSGRARLTVTATAAGFYPPVRLVKYYVDDRRRSPRPSFSLNGEWEWCPVKGAEPGSAPPADAKWSKVNVPSLQSTEQTHCAWYRRSFDAPAHLAGERIVLRSGQILTEAWFYLNGREVAHERHASQPFEVDLSAAFRPGQRNDLLIAVRDWLAYSPRNRDRVARGDPPIFKDSMVDVAGYTGAASLGLGGLLWLEARPAVSVDDLFVVTSVRERKLTVRYRIRNTGPADQPTTLAAKVLDAGQVVKTLPAARTTVPAGKTAAVTVEMPWPDAKLWWPEDPHLYLLQTDLRPAAGAADRHCQRFGFREIRIDGISFYLNGVRTKIRSAWASGASGLGHASQYQQPDRRLEAIWGWQTRCVQEGDHQLTRTHGQAGLDEAAEVADETGLMLKVESECNQTNFTFDQTFWNAALAHELHIIDVYKNHASVMMWSAGNENMWGWIYQGEAAKTLGNRWQLKIVKAMREFDLMRRPIEWEADGDLMGGWEHHALHYPRELSGFPDVPNGAWWGPLDGKTVVPYSMGPITLGQKPLTVGEAFWPATLSHPFGETLVSGDDAYLGGNYLFQAWLDSSRFFVNGFRDVEFALIDTYVPLSIQAPQTVILKQEDRAFIGGRTIHRDVNVHHDLKRPAELTLRWRLEAERPLAQGSVPMKLAPAALKRVGLDMALPAVKQPLAATLRLELLEGGKPVHVETREWRIAPPVAIRVPAGLNLAVYDPLGQTSAMLKSLKVPFTPLSELQSLPGRALLLGRDALKQTPTGPWREKLAAFVQGGGKALILEQSEAPDFLPVPLTRRRSGRTTIAFVRAADHPLLAGLTDADLRWWTSDQYVSAGDYRKPVRGNFLPLVDVGTMDGLLETPLVEEYDGQGSYLLCQLLLTEKAATAPAAGRLLQNALDYLASPTCYRTSGATALLAAQDSALRKALDDARVAYEDLAGKLDQLTTDRFRAAVVDVATGLSPASVEALRAFAKAGGRVLLHRATPDQQPLVESLLGARLRFFAVEKEPSDVQNRVCRGANTGLLSGISNHELFWASNAYLNAIRHEGVWWSYYPGGCPAAERIADWYCQPGDDQGDRATALTRPGTLVQASVGSGLVVLSQLRLDQPIPDTTVTVNRLCSLLLTNLGCTLRGEGGAALARTRRLRQYQFFTVDLTRHANRGLRDDPATGLVGWTNQGENDMRALPTGRQVFGDVPFHIAAPKGAVVLYSESGNNRDLPKEVKGLAVGRRADVLFFLHSMAWGGEKPFRYRVNYEDGASLEVPVSNGRQVIDWWSDPLRSAESLANGGAFIAWTGDNPMRKGVVLTAHEWVNPNPAKAIRDVDFLTAPESNYAAVPVLVGLTGAVTQANEGVVTDVLGTEGVKVKLGTQEESIYYIGVAGIAADHPYHARAVEAHRALVVGQKVVLQSDVVTQTAAGRRLAYVYLGGDTFDINSLVNAKIIGQGLGRLGNFEGNNRERMYLENLGFIAQQRRVGMWAEPAGGKD